MPVSIAVILPKVSLARDRRASGFICLTPSGITTMGKSGRPRERKTMLAKVTKQSVTITVLRTPFFSRYSASWILHAVHEPQPPTPTIAASQWAASSSSAAGGVPLDKSGLILVITPETPNWA